MSSLLCLLHMRWPLQWLRPQSLSKFPHKCPKALPLFSRRLVASVTSINSSLFLGDAIQGDVGLPGDPGQPMINAVVEFVGFPKGDKGLQVCWKMQLFS